jgi:EAL and modified HD-GYP domain-containing signal transduction protein
MTTSVLGSVTLGYTPLWNQWRQRCGIRMLVEAHGGKAVDGQHLLASIAELWPAKGDALMLSVRTPALLNNLLDFAPAQSLWMEIHNDALADALLFGKVRKAQQRGLRMVWTGEPGASPAPEIAPWFHRIQRTLTPQQALQALRASLQQSKDSANGMASFSPVQANGLYEGLASQALVEHALDYRGVSGVVGWPAEEILYGYRFKQIQPSRAVLMTLVKGIDSDESTDLLEQAMGQDPLLNYRFLRFLNSVAAGLRHEVSSVHQGLLTVGLARLRAWLMEQMPHASTDPNLDPIRASLVMRARIMQHLADAGHEEDLRREVFLCGIFSQVDLFLGETMGSAMHRLPLPGRISSAILGQSGPYSPWLEVASALESGNTALIRKVCDAHHMPAAEVNRALLRTLATSATTATVAA